MKPDIDQKRYIIFQPQINGIFQRVDAKQRRVGIAGAVDGVVQLQQLFFPACRLTAYLSGVTALGTGMASFLQGAGDPANAFAFSGSSAENKGGRNVVCEISLQLCGDLQALRFLPDAGWLWKWIPD